MLRLRTGKLVAAPQAGTALKGFLLLALLSGAGAATAAASPSLDLILLTGIGAVIVVPILIRWGTGTFDIFEPLTIFTVAFGIMFLATPIAMLATDSLLIERAGEPTYDIRSTFSLMLAAALIGAIAFQLGYASGLGPALAGKFGPPSSAWHPDLAVAFALTLTVLGVGLFGLFLLQSGGWNTMRDFMAGRDPSHAALFRSSTSYLSGGILLLVPATLVLVATGASNRRPVLVLVAGLVAVLVLLRAGPTGGRMMLLLLAGSLVTYYYLRSGKRPGVASTMILLAVTFTGITFLRDVRTQSAREEQGAVSILADSLSNHGDAARKLLLGGDTGMAASFALEMQVVPSERPYQFGRASVGDLVIRPIPRVLWSEKPLTPREQLIDSLWPTRYAAGVANPEFSSMAWFYLDAGLPGVFLGMFFLGTLFKGAFVFFLKHSSNAAVQVIYASLVPFMVIALRDSPTDTFARMAFVTLPLVLILFAARRTLRPAEQRFAPQGLREGAT